MVVVAIVKIRSIVDPSRGKIFPALERIESIRTMAYSHKMVDLDLVRDDQILGAMMKLKVWTEAMVVPGRSRLANC